MCTEEVAKLQMMVSLSSHFHWEWKEGTAFHTGKGATVYCNNSSLPLVHWGKSYFNTFLKTKQKNKTKTKHCQF